MSDNRSIGRCLSRFFEHRQARLELLRLAGCELRCPECALQPNETQRRSLLLGGRAQCRRCKRWYVWSSNTPYQGSIAAAKILTLITCHAAGIEPRHAAVLAECSRTAARRWYRYAAEHQQEIAQ